MNHRVVLLKYLPVSFFIHQKLDPGSQEDSQQLDFSTYHQNDVKNLTLLNENWILLSNIRFSISFRCLSNGQKNPVNPRKMPILLLNSKHQNPSHPAIHNIFLVLIQNSTSVLSTCILVQAAPCTLSSGNGVHLFDQIFCQFFQCICI